MKDMTKRIPIFVARRYLLRSWMAKHRILAYRRVFRFNAPSWIRVHHAKRWMRGATFPRKPWINPQDGTV